jgi:aryl-alcohol dehydrogenase-like predicted oxidoreductase
MQLGLGTVQFGLSYGINNNEGKTSSEECNKIFLFAKNNNILFVDTAYGYGDAHSVIGQNKSNLKNSKIITKLSITDKDYIDSNDINLLKNAFKTSLIEMKRKDIYAFLFHNEKDLFKSGTNRIIEELKFLKSQGIIKKIGVSIYDIGLIDKIIGLGFIDIVQVPISIFDQRLIYSGKLEKLHSFGIEVHARSIFLQGLLLQNISDIDRFFNPVKHKLIQLRKEAKERNLSLIELIFAFLKGISFIDVAIIGVNNMSQLEQIVNSLAPSINSAELLHLSVEDENILNPSNWKIDAK